MLIAHYIGPAKPGLLNWIGWRLIMMAQKPPYHRVTHTEVILEAHDDGTFTIATSSLVDRGVRVKRTRLNPAHWIITDVPQFEVGKACAWFAEAIRNGMGYDRLGAVGTMLPIPQDPTTVFCTEAVLMPFVPAAHYYTPALCMSLCVGLGHDVTVDLLKK